MFHSVHYVSQCALTVKHRWTLNVVQSDQTKRNPAPEIHMQLL